MRSLVFVEPGRVDWVDRPDPELPDANGALVRPLAVARCDLDVPMVNDGLFPGPFPVGHELAGEVVAVGDAVTSHRIGDVVIVPFQVSCGWCSPCQRHTFAACSTYRAPLGASYGFGPSGGDFGGAVSDLLPVPNADHLLVGTPAGIEPTTLATLSDNVADAYRAVAPGLTERPDGEVLIVSSGSGSIALYAVAVAAALGASRVRYVDRDPARVQIAASFGAEAEVHVGAWPKRFPPAATVVESTGDPDGMMCVLRSTEPYGRCTIVSVSFEPVLVPFVELYTRGVTVHASRADSRRLLPDVIELVTSGRLSPLAVPTTVVPWEDAADAWLVPATKLIIER